MSLQLSSSLGEIDWIPRPRLLQLRRLGLETVDQLLRHYPRRHEDRSEFADFPREESEQPICLCGEVVKTQIKRFGGWKKIFEVTLQEDHANALSQPLVCRWFNLHYIQKLILTGQRLVVFGKPRLRGQRICMEHPEFEVIENDDLGSFSADHTNLSGDRRSNATRVARTDFPPPRGVGAGRFRSVASGKTWRGRRIDGPARNSFSENG
jgi:RecG-like helicase